MDTVLHLISEEDWQEAQAAGEWRPESLASEGFIHGSRDEGQLLGVAGRLYAGRSDMLVLEVDTNKLQHSVVVEPSRSGELYPHIYGPLEVAAVVKVSRLALDEQGAFSIVQL